MVTYEKRCVPVLRQYNCIQKVKPVCRCKTVRHRSSKSMDFSIGKRGNYLTVYVNVAIL